MSFDPLLALQAEADCIGALPVESLGVAVPTCPGWDIADLLSHTGWVHRHFEHSLCLPEGERATRESTMAAGLPKNGSAQHPDAEVLPWFLDGMNRLMLALRTTPPTKQVTTFYGTHPPSLVARRMAHETIVHRWDAQNALGAPDRHFDPTLASDGVDEVLQ